MVTTEAGKAMVLTMRKGGDEAITQIDQGNDVGDGYEEKRTVMTQANRQTRQTRPPLTIKRGATYLHQPRRPSQSDAMLKPWRKTRCEYPFHTPFCTKKGRKDDERAKPIKVDRG